MLALTVVAAVPTAPSGRPDGLLSLRQLNRLRIGYLVMGVGLLLTKWRLLPDAQHMGLKEGTVECMLVGMSALALLGLRHPRRMISILLFEIAWKLTWLAAVALPKWSDNALEGAVKDQAATVLWVVIVLAVIPWRHVIDEYCLAPAEPWRKD